MRTLNTLLAVAAIALPATMQSQVVADTSAQAAAHTSTQMSAPTKAAAEQSLNAELRSAVDSKHAKAGDEITAVTREQSMLNGTRLPKGTTLIGHVTEVAAHSKENSAGTVSMLFDQARLKNGTMVPIRSTIRGLAPSASAQAMAQGGGDMDMSEPGAAAGMQGSGSVRGGGGLLSGARSTVGGVANSTGALAGSALRGAKQATGAVAGAAVRGVSTIPGVNLAAGADASTSGTVSAPGRDVHLENGTQMTLAVSTR